MSLEKQPEQTPNVPENTGIETTTPVEVPPVEINTPADNFSQPIETPGVSDPMNVDTLAESTGLNEVPAESQENQVEFNVKSGTEEFITNRLKWSELDSEYTGLDDEQLKAADALIADPDNLDAKVNFWKVTDKLEQVKKQKDTYGGKQLEMADKLMDYDFEQGTNSFESAKSKYYDKRAETFKKEDRRSSIQEAYDLEMLRYKKFEERMQEIREKQEEIDRRRKALEEELSQLHTDASELLRTNRTEDVVGKLQTNSDRRKEIMGEIESIHNEYVQIRDDMRKASETYMSK